MPNIYVQTLPDRVSQSSLITGVSNREHGIKVYICRSKLHTKYPYYKASGRRVQFFSGQKTPNLNNQGRYEFLASELPHYSRE